ncbi:hypothetical protein PIROE2DRAFT_65227, partial [Piromyces sp. E2]
MNPITDYNPRIVEGRLSDEGVFTIHDALNNTLFTTGIKGEKTKEGEAYYMYISINYDIEKELFDPSYINILKNTTNEVIWSYPPKYNLEKLYSDREEFILTFDGLIYNKLTNEVVDTNGIGSPVLFYENTGICLVLREDGAYAYGESKPFFEKENSHKLTLNEKDGNIYIDGVRYSGTDVVKNLPSKLYCDIIDDNFAMVLEDSLGNIVWNYPPIKKYYISNVQRKNTLFAGRNLWYDENDYCLTFNKNGLHINKEIKIDVNHHDNDKESLDVIENDSTITILPAVNGSLFMIDPNEGNQFKILDSSGFEIENSYININNPLHHKVVMKCTSKTSVAIIDDETKNVLWSYPASRYISMKLNSNLYIDQQLVEKNNGQKVCLELRENGIYMDGMVEPIIYSNHTISYVTLKADGLYIEDNDDKSLLSFEIENVILNYKEKDLETLELHCESYNGIFGMALFLNGNAIWRYPTYIKKTELVVGSKLYDNEILYDTSKTNVCLRLKNGNLLYNDNEILPGFEFDEKIKPYIEYIVITPISIDAYNDGNGLIQSLYFKMKEKNTTIHIGCYASYGKYRLNIKTNEKIIYKYPELETKYVIDEGDSLYSGETLYFGPEVKNSNNEMKKCLRIAQDKLYAVEESKPFFVHPENKAIEYVFLTDNAFMLYDGENNSTIRVIEKENEQKIRLNCEYLFGFDRLIAQSVDKSVQYWTVPKYTAKTSISTTYSTTPNIENSLIYGEDLVFPNNNTKSCLHFGETRLFFPEDNKNIFSGKSFRNGFRLFINEDNKLLVTSQTTNEQDYEEIMSFNTKDKVSLECSSMKNKDAIIARTSKKVIFVYPQISYNILSSENADRLELYDKLVDSNDNTCLTIQSDGIYTSNSDLLLEKVNNLEYIYMDSKTGSVMFDNGNYWINFSDRKVNLPTTMECRNNDDSSVLVISDNSGEVLYERKINGNGSVCNHHNYITSYRYNNELCPGNKITYNGETCLFYDNSSKSIIDGKGEKLFDANGSYNLELDTKTGNLKMGSKILLSFDNPALPVKLDCKIIDNTVASYIEDANGEYLWMHRQSRYCNRLISNDDYCKNIYIYESIYNDKNEKIMELTDKGIVGISSNDYTFDKGLLYLQIDDDGSLSSNKKLIYKTKHKVQAPYSMYCKETSYRSRDTGLVCKFANVYDETEYAIPLGQRRKREVWGVHSINTKDENYSTMELGDTIDCNTYGLSIREDKVVIRYYDSDEIEILWNNIDGEVDYAKLSSKTGLLELFGYKRSGTSASIDSVPSGVKIKNTENINFMRNDEDDLPYTMECMEYHKIGVFDNKRNLLYSLPRVHNIAFLITNSTDGHGALNENMRMCTDQYCCLSLSNQIAIYIDKNGKEKVLAEKEEQISVNSYGQIEFKNNNISLNYPNYPILKSSHYKAACNSEYGVITIYDSNSNILYHYPEIHLDKISSKKSLINESLLCSSKNCCLKLSGNKAIFVTKS